MRKFTFKSYLNAQSGVAAIEFAFILPVMMILYLGMMDLTTLVVNNRKVTTVASSVADLISQNRTTVLKAQVQDYMRVANLVVNPMPANGVTVKVYGYRNSGGTPTKIWETSNGSGPGCSSTPSTSGYGALMTAGNDLVVAQTCMTYVPWVATFLGDEIIGASFFNVEQAVVVRPRSTLVLTCQVSSGGANCT
jgi:Flp pilus assembly protein TadG